MSICPAGWSPTLWGKCVFPWRSGCVFLVIQRISAPNLALKQHQSSLLNLASSYEGLCKSEKSILVS